MNFLGFLDGSSKRKMPCTCTNDTSVGEYYGSKLGGIAGIAASEFAKTAFMSLVGSGDYQLQTNSLFPGGAVSADAQIVSHGVDHIRIRFREYIRDVVTDPTTVGAFNVSSLRINPGNMALFPWLAPIAQQYDQWRPNGIVFEYKSTSSMLSTNINLGSVILMTEYDLNAPIPKSKMEMLNSAYAMEVRPTERALHGVECDLAQTPNAIKYVTLGTGNLAWAPYANNVEDYDLGIFYFATQGSGAPVSSVLGSLYVYYDITFFKEKPMNGWSLRGALNINYASANTTGVYINANPLQVANLPTTGGNGFYGYLANNVVRLPQNGMYQVMLYWAGSGAVAITLPTFTFTNCTSIVQYQSPWNGTTSAQVLAVIVVQCLAQGAQIALGTSGTLPSGTQQQNISIYQISDMSTQIYG